MGWRGQRHHRRRQRLLRQHHGERQLWRGAASEQPHGCGGPAEQLWRGRTARSRPVAAGAIVVAVVARGSSFLQWHQVRDL